MKSLSLQMAPIDFLRNFSLLHFFGDPRKAVKLMTQTRIPSRNVRVLLVEDNLGDAGLTAEVFKETQFPMELFRVSDGDEAMDFLLQKGDFTEAVIPDVVLLDLNMPGRDGHWVLEEIRSNPRLSHIPVVILTGSKNDDDIRRAYEGKANFYIVKPKDLDQLFETIKYLEEVWLSPYRFESA
jgi:two-component system response regulator